MSRKDAIQASGEVIEVLPNTLFKIKLENGAIIDGHLSGKMRMNSIKVIASDKVVVEMSPYDLTKGRITKRNKK
jgi:translation initiation factor IF-1